MSPAVTQKLFTYPSRLRLSSNFSLFKKGMTIFSSYNIFESYTQPEDIFWFEARFTLPHSLYDIHFGIWRKLFWETPFFF
jgi:hypothetical protein